MFWNADPDLIISSESLGIPGDDIDLVNDLGIEDKRLREFRLVLRPATKLQPAATTFRLLFLTQD